MKRFFIELLITIIIVFISKLISDTYLCGGIAGITYVINQLYDEEAKEVYEKIS